jgi:hypothetical protein
MCVPLSTARCSAEYRTEQKVQVETVNQQFRYPRTFGRLKATLAGAVATRQLRKSKT